MKTVLITGIGKGIGRVLAEVFVEDGDSVVGTYLSSPGTLSHERLSLHSLDLSSPESIRACTEELARKGTVIDILINNAGVLLDEDETAVDVGKLRSTLDVNLIGTIDFTERVVPMLSGEAHIVNISSTAGSLELADDPVSHYPLHYPAYKISKAALNMYTRTLALRLKDKGVVVSSIHPGWVQTDMGGAEADVTPEEAARNIRAFALSKPETGYFWFNGEKLPW